MKYQAHRLAWSPRYALTWPTVHSNDYAEGYRSAFRGRAGVYGYFGVNPGWRRTGYLFSHARTSWSDGRWQTQVFYVGRTRRVRRLRRWVPPSLARVYLLHGWRRARARALTGWCWCRLPRAELGGLDTVAAQLRYRLAGRVERRLKQVVLPLLRLTQRLPGVTGALLRANGRFTRRQRADHKHYRWGRPGRGRWSTQVVDRFVTVPLRFGAVGLTLVVGYEA